MTNLSGANLNNGTAVGPQGEGRDSPSRFPAYPAYKDSGVEWLGEVPDHWVESRIKHVADINMGQSPNSDDCNTDGLGLPFLQGNGEFGAKYPTPKQYCPVARKIADAGDLLFSVRAPVGALNEADQIYGIGRGLCAMKASREISKEFLWWFLSSSQSFVDSISTGSTFEAVSAEQVANIAIALPRGVVEQTQIARFLDHETARIDALIEEQQRLIELLKEKRQAVISHAVTKGLDPTVPMKDSGVEWLGEVPAHWDVKKVGHACDIHNNLRTPIDREIRAVRSGVYPYYGPTGVLDYIDDFYVEGEYFLIGEDGDHFLKFEEKPMTFLVDGKFCVNNHAHLVRGKDDCATSWAALYFEARDLFPWLIRQGVGRYKLRKEALVGISITVPPKGEQLRIVDEINSQKAVINRVISESEQSINLLEERRSALISAAVTGKIDVRGWQPPPSENQQQCEALEA